MPSSGRSSSRSRKASKAKPKPLHAGRPAIIETDRGAAVVERLIACARAFAPYETCAAYAGINKDTLIQWLKRGARELDEGIESPYVSLHRDFTIALANAETRLLAVIQTAAAKQWQAAAWILERRKPVIYARRSFVGPVEDDHEDEEIVLRFSDGRTLEDIE